MSYTKNIKPLPLNLLLALSLAILPTPVTAQSLSVPVQRWLEVLRVRGSVTYHNREQRPAQVGDRLQTPGEGIITGARSSSILNIDTAIGTINIAENTHLLLKSLSTTPNNGRITLLTVTKGLARLRVRPFNNPESYIEIQTPAGVAGVRGTEFGVGVDPSGKTNIATIDGTVEAIAQGQTVRVEKGFGSIIIPGEPPTPPLVFTNDVSLRRVRVFRSTFGTVDFRGRVDPLNLVFINDRAVEVDKNGQIQAQIRLFSGFELRVKVQSPLGREVVYRFPVR